MVENIIINESYSSLRERGRLSLSGSWKQAFILMLIYYAIITIPALVLNYVNGYPKDISLFNGASIIVNESPYTIIYWFLINGKVAVVLAGIFLGIVRYSQVRCTDLFKKIEYPAKAFLLFVMVSIFAFLWGLLFIVPGIIARIRYSQAFYILADDNSKSIIQCISESKALMQGNKKKFFIMELSFAGWLILSVAPASITTALLEGYISEIWCNIVFTLLLFPTIWVVIYLKSAEANFYELLIKTNDNSADNQ